MGLTFIHEHREERMTTDTNSKKKRACKACGQPGHRSDSKECPEKMHVAKASRAGKKRKPVKKRKGGIGRAGGGDPVSAAIRVRIRELDTQKEKLEEALTIIERR